MSRRARERTGRRAEAFAAWWLRLKGFTLLARRHKTPAGEIDLVVRRGRLLAFVEVKRRDQVENALTAITERQQARIARAAACYLATSPAELRALQVRFDAVVVTPGRLPQHIADAWRPDAHGFEG